MNLTIKDTARLMGKAEQFVRIGLQRNLLPFGSAVQNPGGRYSYHISIGAFEEYMKKSIEELEKEVKEKEEHLGQ